MSNKNFMDGLTGMGLDWLCASHFAMIVDCTSSLILSDI